MADRDFGWGPTTTIVRPLYGYLTISGWHGSTSTRVIMLRDTERSVRIRALSRTRLAGRGRHLDPGHEAWVPRSSVRSTHELADVPKEVPHA